MKKSKLSNLIFIAVLAVVLLTGLIFTLIAPVDINEYENRTAEKLEKLNISNYLNSKFQDSVESAIADQIPFGIELKRFYNTSFSKFTSGVLLNMMEKEEAKEAKKSSKDKKEDEKKTDDPKTTDSGISSQSAISSGSAVTTGPAVETGPAVTTKSAATDDPNTKQETTPGKDTEREDISGSSEGYKPNMDAIGNTTTSRKGNLPPNSQKYVMNGYRTYKTQLLYGTYGTSLLSSIEVHTDNVNKLAEANPDVKFAAFFLERETDVTFDDGYRNENANTFLNSLAIEHKAAFRIKDFDSYNEEFYHTDHHWSYKGSYRGYKECISMLLPNETPLEPTGEYFIGYCAGSMTDTEATAAYYEPMFMYGFDFPEFVVTANGNVKPDYGGDPTQQAIIDKAISGQYYNQIPYAKIYGDDIKDLVIDNQNDTGNGNILVIGSSYDNACLKLLASHYDCLYSVDMRKWPAAEDSSRTNSFSLSSYIEQHNIGTVLFFGDDWFWTGSTFYIYNR